LEHGRPGLVFTSGLVHRLEPTGLSKGRRFELVQCSDDACRSDSTVTPPRDVEGMREGLNSVPVWLPRIRGCRDLGRWSRRLRSMARTMCAGRSEDCSPVPADCTTPPSVRRSARSGLHWAGIGFRPSCDAGPPHPRACFPELCGLIRQEDRADPVRCTLPRSSFGLHCPISAFSQLVAGIAPDVSTQPLDEGVERPRGTPTWRGLGH